MPDRRRRPRHGRRRAPPRAGPASAVLPLGISAGLRDGIDTSPEDLPTVRGRCEREGLQVLGLRFRSDRLTPGTRFAFLRRELGDAFVAVELEDEDAADPEAALPPHSVLTEHLVDRPGQPTRGALGQALDLVRTRMLPEPA